MTRRHVTFSLAVVAFSAVFVLGTGTPANACSMIIPPTVEQLAGRETAPDAGLGPVVGVYEQQHVAAVPWHLLRGGGTASVVTRYWGVAPDLGVTKHGLDPAFGSDDDCGGGGGQLGEVGYRWVNREGEERYIGWVDVGGGSTTGPISDAQAAMLTAAFGPPIERPVTVGTRAVAWASLWWQPLLGLGLVGGVGYGLVRFHVRGEVAVRGRFRRRYLTVAAVAVGGGLLVIELTRPILGDVAFRPGAVVSAALALGAGAALASVGGWLSRPLTGIAAVPVVAAALFVSAGLGAEGDTFVDARTAWEAFGGRAAAGLVLIGLGLGAAATVGKHWAAYFAAGAAVVGAALIGSGVAVGLSASEGLRWSWPPLHWLLPLVSAGAAAAGLRMLSHRPGSFEGAV